MEAAGYMLNITIFAGFQACFLSEDLTAITCRSLVLNSKDALSCTMSLEKLDSFLS